MNDKERLMKRLSAAQFAVWEMHLYLDTHPCDTTAIEAYNNYYTRYKELLKEYVDRFGMINAGKEYDDQWSWINSPWPWDVDCQRSDV